MRKDAKLFTRKTKGSNLVKSRNSILVKHDDLLKTLEDNNKKLKDINAKINFIKIKISNAKDKLSCETLYKTLKKYDDIKENMKSSMTLNDYILETSLILSKFVELEEREIEITNMNMFDNSFQSELSEIHSKKAILTDEYLRIVDPKYVPPKRYDILNSSICGDCNIEYTSSVDGYVCSGCGNCPNEMSFSNDLSYKELQEYDYKSKFTYNKESHLMEWLRRFTTQENVTVPQEIIDSVILQASKDRITNANDITQERVRKYLRKLGYNKYFDNVITIVNRIQGRPPFKLSSEIENKIKIMFRQMQEPFEKYKNASRKNFLSYSYVLNKMFLILDLPEFSKYFFLLKSPDKLRQQDEIFKKIVFHMAEIDKTVNWKFYPSI